MSSGQSSAQPRMLTARDITTATVTNEERDCSIMPFGPTRRCRRLLPRRKVATASVYQ
jgi:hypothetical protein